MYINKISLSSSANCNDTSNFGTLKVLPSARKVLTNQLSSKVMSSSHLRDSRLATQQLEKNYLNEFLDTLENYFSKFKDCKMTLHGTKKGNLLFKFNPDTKTMGEKTKIVLIYNEDQKLNQCTLENIQDIASEYHQIIKEGGKNSEYDKMHFFRFFMNSQNANIQKEKYYKI